MAKITITIEDSPDGRVKVVSNPSIETMLKMEVSGEKLTAAYGYAFNCLNTFRQISKSNEPSIIIKPPKLGY